MLEDATEGSYEGTTKSAPQDLFKDAHVDVFKVENRVHLG